MTSIPWSQSSIYSFFGNIHLCLWAPCQIDMEKCSYNDQKSFCLSERFYWTLPYIFIGLSNGYNCHILNLPFTEKLFLFLRIFLLCGETRDENQVYFPTQKIWLPCTSLNSACQIILSLAHLSNCTFYCVYVQKKPVDTLNFLLGNYLSQKNSSLPSFSAF